MVEFVVVGLGLAAIPFLVTRMRCRAPIGRKPYRPCRRVVRGLLGGCSAHGRRPIDRLLGMIGGDALLIRRVCDQCGNRRAFVRGVKDGSPYLGCTSFPSCRNTRSLLRPP